jgi:DNA adenine methylase
LSCLWLESVKAGHNLVESIAIYALFLSVLFRLLMGVRLMKSETRLASAHGPSFLRWAGSKRKSLTLLSSAYLDADQSYIEPFAGSAALFFSLKPRNGTLADLNGHLVNAMRQVRDRPKELHRRLSLMPRTSRAYYRARETFNDMRPYGIHAAVLFVYLNRNCFNGLWRTNGIGEFNVPYGGTEMGGNPPLPLLELCSKSLKCVSLKHQDFRITIEDARKGSFIYADPPYFTSTERTFVEYGKKSFGAEDLRDLVSGLVHASKRGASVALTYNEAMPIQGIPREWFRTRFEVTRNVGGFSGARKRQAEILYTNRPVNRIDPK